MALKRCQLANYKLLLRNIEYINKISQHDDAYAALKWHLNIHDNPENMNANFSFKSLTWRRVFV